MKYEESPISQIFGSKIRSDVAKKNSKKSAVIQPYFSIPLDIEYCDSILDSLHLFLSKESLDDYHGSVSFFFLIFFNFFLYFLNFLFYLFI